jgi:transcriptional regulator with XRE-family HTH domain
VSLQPGPPAEAELIRQRREAAVPDMSRRQAAVKAGISASQWSDVERGHKKAGSGVTVPVKATPETLAKMAQVAGVSADDLAAAGRADAAAELRALGQQRDLRHRLATVPGLGAIGDLLPSAAGEELLPSIAAGLDEIEHSDLPLNAKRELADFFVANLIHDATRRRSELLLVLRLAAARRQPR